MHRTGKLLARTLGQAAILVVLAASAFAQQGKVTGKVVDKDGAPLGFVDVWLEGEASNYAETVLSEEDGGFIFSPVPAGSYRLYAFSEGLISDKLTGILVTPDAIKSYTVQLRPAAGAKEETVEIIVSELEFVDPTITGIQSTLDDKFISRIPLQNKRIQDIVNLFPGVVKSGSSDSDDISIGGGSSSQIGYRLNGVSANDPLDGGLRFAIPTASIAQVKLITTGFSAKYGEHSTGLAEIVTKRGTNEFEFSYAMNFRDSRWGAQAISGLPSVQAFVHDILSAEGTLRQEAKAGFALLGVDEVSTRADDNNPPPRHRVRHTISTGGPIVRDEVFFHSTLETLADDFGSGFAGGRDRRDQVLYTGKLNWDIDKDNKLETSFSLDVSDSDGHIPLQSPESTALVGTEGHWTLSLKHDHIFNPEAFLTSQLTVAHDYETARPADERTGVGPVYVIPLPPGGPLNYTVGAASANFNETTDDIRLEETITKDIRLKNSSHTLEMGGHFSRVSFGSFVEQGPQVTDFRIIDDSNFLGSTGPLVGRLVDIGPPVITNDETWSVSAFIQDKWLVTDNFTIDVGLRADYQEFVGTAFVAPRFGFSLDPIGDRKTAFRGSWGIFYDNLFANALQWVQNPDLFYSDIYFAPLYTPTLRKFSTIPITTIYKEALVTPYRSLDPDDIAYLENLVHDRYRLGENLTAPTNKQWSFEIERRLPANMRISANYTENKRTHQIQTDVRTVRVPEPGQDNQFTVRDLVLNTSGTGRYHAWQVSLQKLFSENWEVNLSYTQSRNTGPIPPPNNPIDPNDVFSENGLLGNDRTHVVKVTGHGKLPKNIDMSGDFSFNTGQPLSATILTSGGDTFRPFGRNTLRYPSSRQLNFQLSRPFATADDKLNIKAELSVFNLLNTLNVFSGFGRFEVPEGSARNPADFPPLRPKVLPLGIDVGRSLEVGVTISF